MKDADTLYGLIEALKILHSALGHTHVVYGGERDLFVSMQACRSRSAVPLSKEDVRKLQDYGWYYDGSVDAWRKTLTEAR